jgi:Catalase
MPRIVTVAVSKRLNPIIGRIRYLIRRCCCSATLFKCLHDCIRTRGNVPATFSLATARCQAAYPSKMITLGVCHSLLSPKTLTTASGAPVADNENSLATGPRGPVLFQYYWLLEEMAHFQSGPHSRTGCPRQRFGGLRYINPHHRYYPLHPCSSLFRDQ